MDKISHGIAEGLQLEFMTFVLHMLVLVAIADVSVVAFKLLETKNEQGYLKKQVLSCKILVFT